MNQPWHLAERPRLLLAPMDGYTDRPFRLLIRWIEPRCVVFTEFHSALLAASQPQQAATWFTPQEGEAPLVVQLYGKDPEAFAQAAKRAQQAGAAGVDLNMGCPAKRVVAHQHGSALMQNVELARALVGRVKAAVSIPVSVKTRLGWESAEGLELFVRALQAEGLDAITLHGRTYKQKFEGQADWAPIHALKGQVNLPVFGNGDIRDGDQARACLGRLDGIMVGRAAVENPWCMAAIRAALYREPAVDPPSPSQLAQGWLLYARAALRERSEALACRRLRKFMIRLVESRNRPELRRLAGALESLAGLESLLRQLI